MSESDGLAEPGTDAAAGELFEDFAGGEIEEEGLAASGVAFVGADGEEIATEGETGAEAVVEFAVGRFEGADEGTGNGVEDVNFADAGGGGGISRLADDGVFVRDGDGGTELATKVGGLAGAVEFEDFQARECGGERRGQEGDAEQGGEKEGLQFHGARGD